MMGMVYGVYGVCSYTHTSWKVDPPGGGGMNTSIYINGPAIASISHYLTTLLTFPSTVTSRCRIFQGEKKTDPLILVWNNIMG